MFGDNTSALVPAGDRPDRRSEPQPVFYHLEDLKGKVFWKATDRDSSHFLRLVLERRKPEDVQMIFSELKDQICVLMFDRFGSHVIEKLYEACHEQQMNQLIFSVTADVELLKAVCLTSQGSNSMKKFLSCLGTPDQKSHVISVLQQLTVLLATHKIGCCVVRHCFDVFPAKETEPILDTITDNLFEITTKPTGSRLLGHVIESKDFLLESRQRIISQVIANVHSLSLDGFGRHLVQRVIRLRMQDVVRDIVAQLSGAFAYLSMDWNATVVVLTLMKEYKEEYAPQIISEIIRSSEFSTVLRHPYAEDVLDYAKKYSTGALLKSLNHQIALHSDHFCNHRHEENDPCKSEETVLKVLNNKIPLHSDHLHSHCHGKNIKPRWKI